MADASKRTQKKSKPYSVSRKDAEADALFESIGEGTIATDEHGSISRVNDVALKMLGFKESDVLGKWYPETIVAETADGEIVSNIDRPMTQVFLTGKPVFRRIYFRKKDGSRVPVALTVSPIVLRGVPIGAVEVFRDITEEIELENAKDEFISIASHQLRTPATVVKQYLGMLLDGYMGELSDPQRSVLGTAYEYNDQQLDTISDLLKVAQADSNKTKVVRKKIDLVQLIKSTLDSQSVNYAKRGMSLNLETEFNKAVFNLDPLHIRMVLENLLDNARKYSPEDSGVIVRLYVTKDFLTIEVQDQGFGIAAKDMPRLFQKFSRLDNPRSTASGTGLGLYWAKKLIDLHGGTLTASSKLNHGTTFTINVPAEKAA